MSELAPESKMPLPGFGGALTSLCPWTRSSSGGPGGWRPGPAQPCAPSPTGPETEAAWRPCTEGLHLDQNPFSKPELETVQGMVPLLAVSAGTGGLEVVPRSHRPDAKAELCREFPHLRYSGDWCPLNRSYEDAMLLLAEPGDLVLWDSRTIHGGRVGDGLVSPPPAPSASASLARLSVTVAMVPRARATPEVLQARREGFLKGRIFNHSPH